MAKTAAYMRAYRQRKKQPAPPAQQGPPDWPEAFSDGVDYQKSGDVDHSSRTVSYSLQRQWDQFTANFQTGLSRSDFQNMFKDWDPSTNDLYGYFRTTNSFAINKKLYDPANDGKTDAQIFTRKDRQGRLRDLETIRSLDKAINSHQTQADATYTRFCSPNSLKATFKLSDTQMNLLKNAANMTPAQLAQLNQAIAGSTSYSKAYTSTSANRSMNAFGNPNASQSRGFIFERKLYVPKGTNAYAAQRNAQESEVLFGRGAQTRMMGVTVSNDGHIVLHEMFEGYK